jgi:transposase
MANRPSTPNRHLDRTERVLCFRWRAEGLKQKEIAQRLRRPQTTISSCLASNRLTPTKPKGRPVRIDDTTVHRLILHATLNAENRRKPWREIAWELGLLKVTDATLKAVFEKLGYRRAKAVKKPIINDTTSAARLAWAIKHEGWTESDWDRICSSDESLFIICWGQVYVTRLVDEAFHPDCLVP